jgi:small subunit ribosomal protein S3
MIERDIVEQKKKEFQIQEFISETLKNAGHSHTKLQRTPLGEKVVIHTSRPGIIVGRKGQTISKLTESLKKEFGLDNPQVEIAEVSNPSLDSRIMAERISSELERFGTRRFKGIMHKVAEEVIRNGGVGVEIRLSGKLPSSRSKNWRVAGGYLRKCGDAAITSINKTILTAKLKSGVVGIQVRIMPPGIIMPDEIRDVEEEESEGGKDKKKISSEPVDEKKADGGKEEKPKKKAKSAPKKSKSKDSKKVEEKPAEKAEKPKEEPKQEVEKK